MNYEDARSILELPRVWDRSSLREAYKSKALKYHPDKNTSSEANFEFGLIRSAYEFLDTAECLTYEEENKENKVELDIDDIEKKLQAVAPEKVRKLFEACKTVVNVTKDIWSELRKANNLNKTEERVIKTSLKQMLNDEMYVMKVKNETFYVPLWYPNVFYDLQDNSILSIQIKADLPENVTIDDENRIYITFRQNENINIRDYISPLSTIDYKINEINNLSKYEIGSKITLKAAGLLKICEDNEKMNTLIRQDIIIRIC